MKEINKQLNQLSGHLGIIAVPLNNVKLIQGTIIEYYDSNINYRFNCSKESISYSCPASYSKAGIVYSHSLTAFLEGQSSINDLLLEEMLKFQYVLIIQNWDGNFTRIGDMNKGLLFSYEYATTTQPEGVKGYHITFQGETLVQQKPVTV